MMVDWTVARAVARLAANAGSAPRLGEADFARLASESKHHLVAYTGLTPSTAIPAPEPVDRAEWAQVNLDSLSKLLGPVAERLGGRFDKAGPFAPAMRLATGAAVAAEVGLVVGYMSQRVLGQYELSLLEPELPARLLFVEPNLARALAEQQVDRESFLGWIVLHELTHVLQFSGVPWLREYVGSLLREYLNTVEVRMDSGGFGRLSSLPNPAALVESFREGGLVALVQTREQRLIMDRLQAVMSVIEGYSEHVMDAVGAEVLQAYDGLRDAMQRRRRNRSAPERVLQRLLGLELKMRQYELGKQFCDAVVVEQGIASLNRVWESPEALPSGAELRDPERWIARLDAAQAAA
ncbi:MAG: zinc-dependent metalloprotease [Thermoleophilaceae bacterium]